MEKLEVSLRKAAKLYKTAGAQENIYNAEKRMRLNCKFNNYLDTIVETRK